MLIRQVKITQHLLQLSCLAIIFFYFLVDVTAQSNVKVCPPEPMLAPGDPCPSVCNEGCTDGVCRIRNPPSDVACPDNMPCQVLCDGFVGRYRPACGYAIINCSTNASCDIIFSRGGGLRTAIDCKNTTHSCSIICDPSSSASYFKCNNETSCNCGSNCGVVDCRLGYDCVGDPCFRNTSYSCDAGFRDGSMVPYIYPNGTCSCACAKPNDVIRKPAPDIVEKCLDPNNVCATDSDCGAPARGYCTAPYSYCSCLFPWSGPNCTIHACPHCKNGAICGYPNISQCICTGLWTGENCTLLMGSAGVSRPEIPEQVERCNASVAFVTPVTTQCPSICNFCFDDDAGVPTCWISLPLPNVLFLLAYCPETHRCIFLCEPGASCTGLTYCNGSQYPFVCVKVDGPMSTTVTCNSSSV
eukprot:TRINITY_DN13578_c0_g1_i1.p1 TRINITY_DN13578_c0_g1~~TRINITY_DN13578_c0_g1_i1.p1  ORF type:complete len:413 (+),score=-9.68 TRINITY_DN13578_c0_g1_i1:368-1606(+)